METDSYGDRTDRDRRVPTLNEKGQSHFTEQKEMYTKRVKASGFMLNETIKTFHQELPKSITALESVQADLHTSYKRYDKDANEYLDFLSRSRQAEDREEIDLYFPIMTDLKKRYSSLMDKIQAERDLLFENKSAKSGRSSSTKFSNRSNTSEVALKRAKALSEKVKLQFIEKEAALKREQFDKSLQLEVLNQQKNLAAAEAEAAFLEKTSEVEQPELSLPNEELGPFEKTIHYLDKLEQGKANVSSDLIETNRQQEPESHNPLSPDAESFVPRPKAKFVSSTPHAPRIQTFDKYYQPDDYHQTFVMRPNNNENSEKQMWSTFLTKKNLLIETFQQQKFNDKPDRYVVWKKQFQTIALDIECTPLEEITLLTNSVESGSEAFRMIMSTRSSCADNPILCLSNIWERLDQRFGSAELLESSLKSKIWKLPNMIDRKNLYELHDVLCEIQAVKNITEYATIFSYLDSSLGIRPIVQKLPKFIQDKWINRVVNYKREKKVIFPPFTEFVRFISEMSVIRNDPGLMFETFINPNQNRNSVIGKSQTYKPRGQQSVSSKKTDINSNTVNTVPNTINYAKRPCLLHKQSKHTTNQCRIFQGKSLQDRKTILREHNFCLRCCETSDHFVKNCDANVKCYKCKSTSHCTALHVDNIDNKHNQSTENSEKKHGEELISARCTDICGVPKFTGKSCARIVPVRIYPRNQPDNQLLAYAMLDDQSNRTLGKSALFDYFAIDSIPMEYTMQSCAGKSTTSGRIIEDLIVEGINDNNQLSLPPVLECDNMPDNHAEIPTPDIVLHYPHMVDISDSLLPYGNSMQIMLLVGRDLPEAHHVIEQRIGPPRSPFAQRSPLGWTIIGDVCLSGQHCLSTVVTRKTCVTENGRPTSLEPCDQIVHIRKTILSRKNFDFKPTRLDIFETTSQDNKLGLSIEDRKFIGIMDDEFKLSEDGKWIAPLPFREPHHPMPDNYKLALYRAKSLDASLHKSETKKQHFLEFMQKIFDSNHVEIAPYLPPERERWYLPLFGVYHPRKPEQIRGVFDFSAKYMNTSLNDQLLQGPDLITVFWVFLSASEKKWLV